MKVLFLFGDLVFGGAERQALLVAHHLKEHHGADITVWGLYGDPGGVVPVCEEHGFAWRALHLPCPRKGLISQWITMRRLKVELRRAGFEVILPYCHHPNVFAGMLWRSVGAKVCIWNQRDAGLHRLHPCFERCAVRRTRYFIANCQTTAAFPTGTLGIEPARVQIVRHGIRLAKPQQDCMTWRSQLGATESTFVACFVANLMRVAKDHATLLRAWRIVLDRLADQRHAPILVFAGHFLGTEGDLKALAAELGLESAVKFLGGVADIAGLLDAVDLCLFSSLSEATPQALLEAMAAGLPAVATDIPGVREALSITKSQGRIPLVVPGDHNGFADWILYYIANPEQRRMCGQGNQHALAAEFSVDRMCRQTTAAILRALGRSDEVELAGLPRSATADAYECLR